MLLQSFCETVTIVIKYIGRKKQQWKTERTSLNTQKTNVLHDDPILKNDNCKTLQSFGVDKNNDWKIQYNVNTHIKIFTQDGQFMNVIQ